MIMTATPGASPVVRHTAAQEGRRKETSSARRSGSGRRASPPKGFTIVEILIVIIIIVILAGLLLPAVMAAITQAKITATRFEILNIGIALDKYQAEFATYPPSCVWWDGGKWFTSYSDTRETMDGGECLVYFLCGPAKKGLTVGSKTYGPYLEPKVDALFRAHEPPPSARPRPFDSMLDAFRLECVYLYFKADRTQPSGYEYNPRHNSDIADAGGSGPSGRIAPTFGRPLTDATGNYHFPTKFQILSPGPDKRYNTDDDISNVTSQ